MATRMNVPDCTEIKNARKRAGLTQAQAAELVHYSFESGWSRLEHGLRAMPLDKWELFLIKTNQHPVFGKKT